MAYTSRNRGRREPLLTTFLYSTTYRGALVCVLAFCVFVAGAAWALRGSAPVRRIYLWNQPGALYHVRSDGEVVPTGGTDQASQPAAPPVAAHANLLDRQYHITAEFGSYPEGGAHYGLDLDAWTGTLVHAPVGGTVTEVQRGCTVGDLSCGKGWGNHVWFQSVETGHYILIAHFSQLNDWVQVGATFDAGAPLGLSGSTGYSSGPHVHIQVNPTQMGNPGSTQPAWEFPWLHCTEPVLGALFAAGCP